MKAIVRWHRMCMRLTESRLQIPFLRVVAVVRRKILRIIGKVRHSNDFYHSPPHQDVTNLLCSILCDGPVFQDGYHKSQSLATRIKVIYPILDHNGSFIFKVLSSTILGSLPEHLFRV